MKSIGSNSMEHMHRVFELNSITEIHGHSLYPSTNIKSLISADLVQVCASCMNILSRILLMRNVLFFHKAALVWP